LLNERKDVGKIWLTTGINLRPALGVCLGAYEIVDLLGASRMGHDLSRASSPPRRLTFESDDAGPVWSPDGSSIAYESRAGDGRFTLFLKPSSGAGKQEENPRQLTLVLNSTAELER
jgi:hypothetical protein